MPRATFAGVTFDLLLSGLEDAHGGMTTVREVPGGDHAWVDLGGPALPRRQVTIKVDSEADYLTLAALPGTAGAAGALTSEAEGAPKNVVLLSLSRTTRHGTGWQLCRTEWLYTGAAATAAAGPVAALPTHTAAAPTQGTQRP
jgi:hypothetical protein